MISPKLLTMLFIANATASSIFNSKLNIILSRSITFTRYMAPNVGYHVYCFYTAMTENLKDEWDKLLIIRVTALNIFEENLFTLIAADKSQSKEKK